MSVQHATACSLLPEYRESGNSGESIEQCAAAVRRTFRVIEGGGSSKAVAPGCDGHLGARLVRGAAAGDAGLGAIVQGTVRSTAGDGIQPNKGSVGYAVDARLVCCAIAVVLAACIVGACLVLFGMHARSSQIASIDSSARMSVSVYEGDTLWGIAERYGDGSVSQYDNMDWIMKNNNLATSTLAVGQVLIVPDLSR